MNSLKAITSSPSSPSSSPSPAPAPAPALQRIARVIWLLGMWTSVAGSMVTAGWGLTLLLHALGHDDAWAGVAALAGGVIIVTGVGVALGAVATIRMARTSPPAAAVVSLIAPTAITLLSVNSPDTLPWLLAFLIGWLGICVAMARTGSVDGDRPTVRG